MDKTALENRIQELEKIRIDLERKLMQVAGAIGELKYLVSQLKEIEDGKENNGNEVSG